MDKFCVVKGLALFGLVLGFSQPALGAPTQAFIVQPISVPPPIINPTGCWPGIYISLLNTSNQPGTIPVGTSVTISLQGTATTTYYSDAQCTLPISSLTLTGSASPQPLVTVYAKDSLTETASVTVSGIDTTQYNVHSCAAAPQPATPQPATTFKGLTNQALVSGSQNSPDGNNGPVSGMVTYNSGENFTTEVLGTPTFSACAQIAPSTSFVGEAIPSGQTALVTVYGTPSYGSNGVALSTAGTGPTTGSLSNATIRVMQYVAAASGAKCSSGMQVVCNMSKSSCYCPSWGTAAPSAAPPTGAGIPATITPATKPAKYATLGYFALPAAPQDAMPGSYTTFTITTAATGDIGYAVQADVVGSTSLIEKQFKSTGGTNFGPLLAFTTTTGSQPPTEQYLTANQCSSSSVNASGSALNIPVTLSTTDGNGVQTNVLPGNSVVTNSSNALSITVTSTPAELFVDSACYFPAIGMTIANPPVSQPAGTPTGTLAYASNQLNFYFRSVVAENLDLGASYVLNNLTEQSIPMVDKINAPDPAAILVSMPSAVNQSTPGQPSCSSGILISLEDAYGNLSGPAVCPKSITLSGDSTATFFSDSACTNPIAGNILSFPLGISTQTIYVTDTQPENLAITASDTTNYSAPACMNGTGGQTSGGQMVGASGTIPVLTVGDVAPPNAALVANLTRNLYIRLVGVPPSQSDLQNPATVYAKMYQLVQTGQMLQAAELATAQDGFYNITIRNLATSLSNQLFNPLYPLNDFVTTWIGIARDGIDARQLLTSNYIYVPNSYGTKSGASWNNLTGSCAQPQYKIYDETGAAYTIKDSSGMTYSSTNLADLYSNGAPYYTMDLNFINLRKNLVQVPQCAYNSFAQGASPTLLVNSHLETASGQQAPASAGLLTTRAWGIAHLYQGTNRRAIRQAMNVFLCRDITALADITMADGHVRRDVDRAPGGVASTYTNTCIGCHAGMDAMAGSYAFFDTYWPNNVNPGPTNTFADSFLRTVYSDTTLQTYADNEADPEDCNGTSATMPKVKRNCVVYPAGNIPGDDSWVNEFIGNQNSSIGWAANVPLNGNGINALGNMLANSAQFGSCMATRAFTEVCKRAPESSQETADVQSVANDFQTSHSFTRLFALTATLPECLANGGGN